MFNTKTISRIIGFLLLIMGGFMSIPMFFALAHGESDWSGFGMSILCAAFFGFIFMRLGEKSGEYF